MKSHLQLMAFDYNRKAVTGLNLVIHFFKIQADTTTDNIVFNCPAFSRVMAFCI